MLCLFLVGDGSGLGPKKRAEPMTRSALMLTLDAVAPQTGTPSLYRTLAVAAPGILRSKVTETMWDTSIKAADAVLAHLAAGD